MSEQLTPEMRAHTTGKMLGIVTFIFAVALVVHQVLIVDSDVISYMLTESGNDATKNAINGINNSIRYTGILYIIAYATGVLAMKFQHPYLWWFLVAIFVSQVFNALLYPPILYVAIYNVKGFFALVPYFVVVVGSLLLAIWMIVVSIKRKSTFNR